MRSLLVLSLAVVLFGLACSGDDGGEGGFGGGGGTGGGGGIAVTLDPAAFCEVRRDAICRMFAECYPGNVKGATTEDCLRNPGVQGAFDACLSGAAASLAPLKTGLATFDEAASDACVAALDAQCGGELWWMNTETPYPCPVGGFVHGTKGATARCTTDADCNAQNFCHIQVGACFGVCELWAAEGDPCGAGCNSSLCAPGLACVSDDLHPAACGTCANAGGTLPKEGEPCTARNGVTSFCELPLVCVLTTPGDVHGTCSARLAKDAPCAETWECASGLVCTGYDAASKGTCKEPIAGGEPCPAAVGDSTFVGVDPCAVDAICDGTVCKALAKMGEECRTSMNDDPLACGEGVCIPNTGTPTVGTCVKPLAAGTSCSGGPLQLACEAGTRCRQEGGEGSRQCFPPSDAGAKCDDPVDCASGRCVNFICLGEDESCEQ